MKRIEFRYTIGEEIANSITHGLGLLLSIVGLVLLVVFSAFGGDPWRIVSVSIFGAALLSVYLASTLYHAIPHRGAKVWLRRFDHAAIYLLIAGTYTPFLLVSLRGPWGWSLFGVLWGAAVVGVVFKSFFAGRHDKASTALYIAMGWAILVAIKPAMAAVPTGAIVLMTIGGLAYTCGVAFYAWRRLPYHHAIWHLFVLVGSVTHFFAIFFYLVPTP